MAKIDCSVPDELLRCAVTGLDTRDFFGARREYFIGDVSVAAYEQRIPKVNTFRLGQTDPGFDLTGKDIVYPVSDSAGEFVSVIEARLPGSDEITNRGVHVQKKFGALAEMSQGSF